MKDKLRVLLVDERADRARDLASTLEEAGARWSRSWSARSTCMRRCARCSPTS
jgi:PleD family two-component response regulator